MKKQISPDDVYSASDDVVVRTVENSIVIIPLTSGTGDTENKPYLLNTTGQLVWKRLNGRRNLKSVIAVLASEFETPARVIEKDVTDFVRKLLKKKILVAIPPN